MKDNKTESVRVNVTPEVRRALEEIAEQDDISVAHVIRQAIKFFLTSDFQLRRADHWTS